LLQPPGLSKLSIDRWVDRAIQKAQEENSALGGFGAVDNLWPDLGEAEFHTVFHGRVPVFHRVEAKSVGTTARLQRAVPRMLARASGPAPLG
jgi:hypothetical protein